MFRNTSVGLFAASAAMAGLVWAGRTLWVRLKPGTKQLAKARPGSLTERAGDPGWEAEALDDIARLHALHDMQEGPVVELDRDTRDDPEDIDELLGATVGSMEHGRVADEPYDAVDAEDVGAEWLLRATQATPPEGWNASELLEGTHVLEPRFSSDGDPSEDAYGSDQEGSEEERRWSGRRG